MNVKQVSSVLAITITSVLAALIWTEIVVLIMAAV